MACNTTPLDILSNSEIYLRAIELLRLPFANYIETLLRASKPSEEVDKIISFYMDNRRAVELPLMIKVYFDFVETFPDLKHLRYDIDRLRRLRNKAAHGEGLTDSEVSEGLSSCELLMEVVVSSDFWPIYQQIVVLNRYYQLKRANMIIASWERKMNNPETVDAYDVDLPWPDLLSIEQVYKQCNLNIEPIPGSLSTNNSRNQRYTKYQNQTEAQFNAKQETKLEMEFDHSSSFTTNSIQTKQNNQTIQNNYTSYDDPNFPC